MEVKRKYRISYRIFSLLLIVSITFAGVYFDEPLYVKAAATLNIKTAITLAIVNSEELEDIELQIDAKEAAKSSAIKSIEVRRRKMASFRWTPLFSFKFPTTPNGNEEWEFETKPEQIQVEINKLMHKYADKKIEIERNIYELFVKIYTLQQKIDFNNERLTNKNVELSKNESRLARGLASEEDVKAMKKSISSLEKTIATDEKNLIESKEKLSKMIKLDVTTGFEFANPYLEADIPRKMLKEITQYTLDNNDEYYAFCYDAMYAKASLRTYYAIFNDKYKWSDMQIIAPYINAVLHDQDINKKAFKNAYKAFIKKIDSYWEGKIRVFIFIKIPRKWLKNEEKDGSGYISDDPEALQTASLEYTEKRKARDNYKEELTSNVKDTFNNYVSQRNAYLDALESVEDAKEALEKGNILNKAGKMTYDEYANLVTTYEDAQLTAIESLSDYSNTLYEFNRLSCGKVMEYLMGTGIGAKAADSGVSFIESTTDTKRAFYYIEPIVQNSEFELHVYIPPDFKVPITDYELWADKSKIGKRTSVLKGLRHEQLDLTGDEEIKIRLFNNGTIVDDCIIDGFVYSGNLSIEEDSEVVTAARVLGTYDMTTDDNNSTVTLSIKPNENLGVKTFKVTNSTGSYLISDDAIPVDDTLKYMLFVTNSVDKLKIELYNENDEQIATCKLDASKHEIVEITE